LARWIADVAPSIPDLDVYREELSHERSERSQEHYRYTVQISKLETEIQKVPFFPCSNNSCRMTRSKPYNTPITDTILVLVVGAPVMRAGLMAET
jgi:hypothetical protein